MNKSSVSTRIREAVAFLFSILFVLTNVVTSYAHTNDDVRRLLGKPEVDSAEFHDYVDYLEAVLENSTEVSEGNSTSETSSSATSGSQAFENSLAGRVLRISDKQSEIVNNLVENISNGSLLADSKESVSQLLKITDTLNEFKGINYFSFTSAPDSNTQELINDTQHDIEWYFDPLNAAEINNSLAYRKTLMDDTYDIGLVGTPAKMNPIATKSVEVTTGFRGVRNTGTPLDTQSSNGVFLKSNENGFDSRTQQIKSLFNGVVTQVHHSETYGNWLEIQSGKGLKISYSLLGNIFVKPGDTVSQNQIIGTGGNENGEIYVEAILDNEYINPCSLMGADIVKAHNEWYTNNLAEAQNSEQLTYKKVPDKQDTDIWDELLRNKDTVEYVEDETDTSIESETQVAKPDGWQEDSTYE